MIPTVYPGSADTRRTDPVTSHEARDSISVEALAESQQEVLAILSMYGPLEDHRIHEAHEVRAELGHALFKLSGSRLRTARKELTELGRVVSAGDGQSPTGNRSKLWAVAS